MINIRKIASMAASGALIFSSFATPVFATTIEISGNGADSENEAEVQVESETTVVQNNDADIRNYISSSANTGDNEAEDNTGGDVSIDTGDATSTTNVSNQANVNIADLQNCGTCNQDVDVLISGNGADSENEVEVKTESEVEVYQNNRARIENLIGNEAETGDNEAEDNTGGDVSIDTGDATATTTVSNLANANVVSIGNGNEGGGSLSAVITGNGADSENEIEYESEREVLLVQDNWADIENWIENEAETGDNEAEDNTGGDVSIDTGDATATVDVVNAANFNLASLDCCLLEDLVARISGNGADSENEIELELEDELEVFQGDENRCPNAKFDNWIENEAETGDNEAEENTGEDSDVDVNTGSADQETNVENAAGVNIFTKGESLELPEFDFHFDLSELLEMLNLS